MQLMLCAHAYQEANHEHRVSNLQLSRTERDQYRDDNGVARTMADAQCGGFQDIDWLDSSKIPQITIFPLSGYWLGTRTETILSLLRFTYQKKTIPSLLPAFPALSRRFVPLLALALAPASLAHGQDTRRSSTQRPRIRA
jgi:hypothetical protein